MSGYVRRAGPLAHTAPAVVYDHDRWRCRIPGCWAEPKGWQDDDTPARTAHEHYVRYHQPREEKS